MSLSKEKMEMKMNEFIKENDYYNGFTAYRAYCDVFGLTYNDVRTIESEEMLFDEFIEWLEDFMYYNYEDYRVIDIFGSPNIIYYRID